MIQPRKSSISKNPFRLDEFFKAAHPQRLCRPVQLWVESLLGLDELARRYEQLPVSVSPQQFVENCFKSLGIGYVVESGDIENIPKSGPTVIVANHPFGGVEGMLLIELLSKYRNDVRVMANGILRRIPELREVFLAVNPYDQRGATQANVSSMREATRWLKQDGLLVVFPAGDVASLRWNQLSLEDGQWSSSIARLARLCDATVVPVYFSGRNSILFCAAGLIHPLLKTLLLPRELLNKCGKTLRLRVGRAFDKKRLFGFENMQSLADYLRLRTCWLGNEPIEPRVTFQPDSRAIRKPIAEPQERVMLRRELEGLPTEQCLAQSGDLQVWFARAELIPNLLQEIGRQREISFRAVGEGTGKETDLDLYDRLYLHLFVWDSVKEQVVGGYRLGLVDEIIHKYGRRGLYSYSLFRYKGALLQQISPAIELGRSFVRPEYQKSFAPLMLLWKGIGQYIVRNPKYANLFGPVSISNEYTSMSQLLLIRFLKQNLYDAGLGRHVKPRHPYRDKKQVDSLVNSNNMKLEELSGLIADIEEDDKGVPVLIRQYLKMGGKMLGFNVDTDFGSCVDGLIRVDLRRTDTRVLSKYLGVDGVRVFQEWHGQGQKKAG
ncbi:MAG: GNAT family N-acyltransferase [Thiohalophilus sp.]|jgi:putative hemolysin